MNALDTDITRRGFLKRAGALAALVGLGSLATGVALEASSGGEADDQAWGMLIDLTRCTGCESCALACKEANELPNPEQAPTRLDSGAYSFIDKRSQADGEVFIKRQCMHCVHPGCASACTVGALKKTKEGPVVYDAAKCIGCRYCQYACPFSVPAYDWQNPLGLIHKCELCKERLSEGEQPACVAACPTGAIQFGRRRDLLAQAHARIQSNPGRYVDQVYGEHEAGGTSMLYLSAVPFSELGFPELGETTVSHYAESVMVKTPIVAATVATIATGLHFTMKRRSQASESHHSPDTHDTHDTPEDAS